MASVVKMPEQKFRLYIKGAPETILQMCVTVVADVTKPTKLAELTSEANAAFENIIVKYSAHSLRTLGFAYRDFESWPLGTTVDADSPESLVAHFRDLTLLGVVGIKDPLRPGVKDAIAQCQQAGVTVRMVTGDNIGTARAIATECGILTEGGIILEGVRFRDLSARELYDVIPRLQVLARSTPDDKSMLVKRLKAAGEIVAVTGDGTNDGPALRAADVGFSMGLSGTEVAKEASSIVLIDDNFSSIVKAIEWGRTVNDAIRRFLQVCS